MRGWRLALAGPVVVGIALLMYGAFDFGRIIAPAAQRQEARSEQAGTTASIAGTSGSVESAQASSTGPQQGSAPPSDSATLAKPSLSPSTPVVSRAATFSPFALPAVLMLIVISSVVLKRRSGLVLLDSPEFSRALEVWKEFIIHTHTTLRATRRAPADPIHGVEEGHVIGLQRARRGGEQQIKRNTAG